MPEQPFGTTKLDAITEESFMQWHANMMQLMPDINPDPNDPEHYYDYRGWFLSGIPGGVDPHDEGRYHAPDEFKLLGHPNTLWAANQFWNEGVQLRPEASLGMNAHRFDSLLGMDR
jgi:hypothetical protein